MVAALVRGAIVGAWAVASVPRASPADERPVPEAAPRRAGEPAKDLGEPLGRDHGRVGAEGGALGGGSSRAREEATGESSARPLLRRYLTRPVMGSPRHLDHGVIGVAVAGGWPHLYRLELAVGLLDHLTLGVTASWLPRQRVPRWSPRVAVAFFRGERFEVGAFYFRSLRPERASPAARSMDWGMVSTSFSMRWVSGGFDAGAVRWARPRAETSEGAGSAEPPVRWQFAGGVHLRVGTRRVGVIAQLLAPKLFADLALEVRFGAFERRPRGGWRVSETVWSTDRRLPSW